jgi:alpha-tubulin suppressor-like RCC1 family protein
VLDRPTDFEVTGTDLNDGMKFQLAGCANVAEAAGGSKTRRVFSCMASGTTGGHTLQLYSSASDSTSLATKTIDYLTPVVKVAETNLSLTVLKADGSVWVWANDWAASTPTNTVITRTELGSNFTDFERGESFGLGIRADGTLWAWGSNGDGAFGAGYAAGSPTPVQIDKDFSKVAAKGAHTTGGGRVVGLKRDGTLWAWGSRSSPIPNSSDRQYVPHQFGSGGFSDLATGSTGASMALQANGSLWSWSENISDTPFVVKKIGDDYQTVATAYEATFGIKKNGELWAWGRNAPNRAAQAGSADTPVLLGQGFASLSAGAYYVMALKTDGTLWAHGSNSEGQFGNGSTIGGGPVQVATGVRKVWAGDSCTVIEKRDGTLWGTSYCALGVTSGGLPPYGFRKLPQF